MFKFDFDLTDENDSPSLAKPIAQHVVTNAISSGPLDKCQEIRFPELLENLPPAITYSLVNIHGPVSVPLPRRDLFDARFQLISPSSADENPEGGSRDLDFIDAPSDLVPGVYEGGLKTWECSIDLAAYLSSIARTNSQTPAEWIRGKHCLEVGCGTAIPSLYLLYELFQEPEAQESAASTVFYLQDYNRSVIELMTMPNILLTWYLSPAAKQYREAVESEPQVDTSSASASDSSPSKSTNAEVEIGHELISAFTASLESLQISLRFFSGSWDGFLHDDTSPIYGSDTDSRSHSPFADIVLTSETIYRTESLESLLALMSSATSTEMRRGPSETPSPICLVAAKVVYFGVGGGVNEFIEAVEHGTVAQGKVETVWEQKRGVGRVIMRVQWE